MSEDEENGAAAAPPAAKSKALPILLVINTLLLTGVLIFVMKRPAAQAHGGDGEAKPAAEGHGEGHGEGKEEKPAGEHGAGEEAGGPGPTVRFDNFTVQLKSLDVDRYAHLGLEIELADEATKGRVERKVAPIRDLILGYLSDRTPDELRGSEGLKQLKEAMIKNLEELIPGHRVRAVYITDFIIQ